MAHARLRTCLFPRIIKRPLVCALATMVMQSPERYYSEMSHSPTRALLSTSSSMYEPVHIVLVGLPGAGKSTLGNNLLGCESFAVSENIDRDGTLKVSVQRKPGMVVYDTPGLSSKEAAGWTASLHSELSRLDARKVIIMLVMDSCVRRLSSWVSEELCYVINCLLYGQVTLVVVWSFTRETSKANLTVKKQQLDSALHRIIPGSIIEHKTLKTLSTYVISSIVR
jgi:GTPase Era involved in 16S rRNA processing